MCDIPPPGGRRIRGRLLRGEAGQSNRSGIGAVPRGQPGLVVNLTGPAFQPPLAPPLVAGLALGEEGQQVPEVVAVLEARELAATHGETEAVEGAEGDVLLVRRAAGKSTQLGLRQADEAREKTIPDVPGGGGVARLQQVDPVGDRTLWRHRWSLKGAELGRASFLTPAAGETQVPNGETSVRLAEKIWRAWRAVGV